MDNIDEAERLIAGCRLLAKEIESLLLLEQDRSSIVRYKRLIDELRRDNERLYRENKLMRSNIETK